MENKYVCECGKIFYKPNSFNGHKAGCKIHNLIKYGNLDVLECHRKTFFEKGRETQQKNNVDKKEEKDKLWVSEKHNCEHCGKVMTEKFGSGRFCSRQCANSRVHSEETKQKISSSLNEFFRNNPFEKVHMCKDCGNIIEGTGEIQNIIQNIVKLVWKSESLMGIIGEAKIRLRLRQRIEEVKMKFISALFVSSILQTFYIMLLCLMVGMQTS